MFWKKIFKKSFEKFPRDWIFGRFSDDVLKGFSKECLETISHENIWSYSSTKSLQTFIGNLLRNSSKIPWKNLGEYLGKISQNLWNNFPMNPCDSSSRTPEEILKKTWWLFHWVLAGISRKILQWFLWGIPHRFPKKSPDNCWRKSPKRNNFLKKLLKDFVKVSLKNFWISLRKFYNESLWQFSMENFSKNFL